MKVPEKEGRKAGITELLEETKAKYLRLIYQKSY